MMKKLMLALMVGLLLLSGASVVGAMPLLQEEDDTDDVLLLCEPDSEIIHPVLNWMAEEYEIAYEVLLGYFCEGYGVGEIKLALMTAQTEAAQEAGLDWEALLAMKTDDVGWGDIWQELGLIGKTRVRVRVQVANDEEFPYGPPENANPKWGDDGYNQVGPPDHAGPKLGEKVPGPPQHAGPKK